MEEDKHSSISLLVDNVGTPNTHLLHYTSVT